MIIFLEYNLKNYLTASGFQAEVVYVTTNSLKEIINLLEHKQRLMLIGPSGIGKSNALRALYYYYKYIKTGVYNPVLLNTASFSTSRTSWFSNCYGMLYLVVITCAL